MRPIRASEISSFLYCKRAWWYHQKGTVSSNVEELAEGTELHLKHGRAVLASALIRMLAYTFLLIGIVFLAISVTDLIL
jgi:CRISPR/Cas system-associated exonuclease Cas4 (RecB family)